MFYLPICVVPKEPRKETELLELELKVVVGTGVGERGCWETNSGHWEDHWVLGTTEPQVWSKVF